LKKIAAAQGPLKNNQMKIGREAVFDRRAAGPSRFCKKTNLEQYKMLAAQGFRINN
jgi:hypothetical protein